MGVHCLQPSGWCPSGDWLVAWRACHAIAANLSLEAMYCRTNAHQQESLVCFFDIFYGNSKANVHLAHTPRYPIYCTAGTRSLTRYSVALDMPVGQYPDLSGKPNATVALYCTEFLFAFRLAGPSLLLISVFEPRGSKYVLWHCVTAVFEMARCCVCEDPLGGDQTSLVSRAWFRTHSAFLWSGLHVVRAVSLCQLESAPILLSHTSQPTSP